MGWINSAAARHRWGQKTGPKCGKRWTRDFLSPFKADVDRWQYLFVVVVDCGTSRFELDSVALVAAQPECLIWFLLWLKGLGVGMVT